MATKLLRYTGPLPECGFTGPVTGFGYLAHGDEPFAVAADDAPGLLRKYAGVLEEAPAHAPRERRRGEPEPAEAENVSAGSEEGDDGEVDGQDAA
mgnify:CR=1 FL=1